MREEAPGQKIWGYFFRNYFSLYNAKEVIDNVRFHRMYLPDIDCGGIIQKIRKLTGFIATPFRKLGPDMGPSSLFFLRNYIMCYYGKLLFC